jgi:hypothetical protein
METPNESLETAAIDSHRGDRSQSQHRCQESRIGFIDFGALNNIIVANWKLFEILLRRQSWVQHIFETMERSRNVIMHSGELPVEDVERLGTNLHDWMKQTGG